MNRPFSVEKPEESSGFLFWKVSTSWQRGIRDLLEPLDLTHTQFVLLASLRWLDGATQAELSRHSGCDSMTVSAVVRTLAAKGWASRRDDDRDRRTKWLEITACGSGVVDQAIPLIEAFDQAFFQDRLGDAAGGYLLALRTLAAAPRFGS